MGRYIRSGSGGFGYVLEVFLAFFLIGPALLISTGSSRASSTVVERQGNDHAEQFLAGDRTYSTEVTSPVRLEDGLVPCRLDIYFLIDLTATFGGEVDAFGASAPAIVQSILDSNPDTRFGLGGFQDYPYGSYGLAGDLPYFRIVDLTTNVDALYNGISELTLGNGLDIPESQLPALYQAATGAGDGPYIAPGQQASFRAEATKLIVLWTDAPFHRFYSVPSANPASFEQAAYAIEALGYSKVLGITSGGGGLDDLNDIVQTTGGVAPFEGVHCDGDGVIDIQPGKPLVCTVGANGEGISEAMIALIEASYACHRIALPAVLK